MLTGSFELQKKNTHTCGRYRALLSVYKPISREPDRLRVVSEHDFEVIIPKSADSDKTMHNILAKYTSWTPVGNRPAGAYDVYFAKILCIVLCLLALLGMITSKPCSESTRNRSGYLEIGLYTLRKAQNPSRLCVFFIEAKM